MGEWDYDIQGAKGEKGAGALLRGISPRTLGGLVVGGLTMVIYLLTMVRGVAPWDCGEFIACAHGLEVPHAPGAPLYLLMGRLFDLLFGWLIGTAWAVNLLSAVCGAGATVLLYLSILETGDWLDAGEKHRGRSKGNEYSTTSREEEAKWRGNPPKPARNDLPGRGVIAGVISLGVALSYSVWISSTEAEVYSPSLLLSGLCVYLMLRWARGGKGDIYAVRPQGLVQEAQRIDTGRWLWIF